MKKKYRVSLFRSDKERFFPNEEKFKVVRPSVTDSSRDYLSADLFEDEFDLSGFSSIRKVGYNYLEGRSLVITVMELK